MSEFIIECWYDFDDGWIEGEHREEIVRCSDCKYYDDCDAGCSYFVLAESKLLHIKNPNGFCAWAKWREK